LGQELSGSLRELPPECRRIRPVDPSERGEVTIYLRRRYAEGTISSHPSFTPRHPSDRGYVARVAFADNYGAAQEDVEAVGRVAEHAGLVLVEQNLARRSVRLAGAVGTLTRLFGTVLGQYAGPSGPFRGRVGTLDIPAGLEDRLAGVFGLDNRPQLRTHFRFPHVVGVSYSPKQVAAGYSFPVGSDGSGQTIGILEFGGGFRPQDIESYFKTSGLPVPTVATVSVDGGTNAPTGDANGADAEVELDIEIAGAVAPGARIVVYFAPNNDQGFVDALTTAIHDSTYQPNVLSISWGGPESSWTGQARAVFNQATEDATAMGITILASAGDSGATDGEPAGALVVDFPASGPYVLGCGGTRLLLEADRISEEVVWNELADGEGATGGGVSQFFARPSYQSAAGVPTGQGGFVGRGVPDVSGDADPTTGYAVLVDGGPMAIGGTSAVAPLWAGLVVRLNQTLGAPLGFLQPLIYLAAESATFHDITQGNNGGFDAGPGWDACTGLGSPNGSALLAALQRK
jgi:kumamolisin